MADAPRARGESWSAWSARAASSDREDRDAVLRAAPAPPSSNHGRRRSPSSAPSPRRLRSIARASVHAAAATPYTRRGQANTKAALVVARELLRCRLAEAGHDALLERVMELLEVATTGADPFCTALGPRASPEAGVDPRDARAPFPEEPEGSRRAGRGRGAARSRWDMGPPGVVAPGGSSPSHVRAPPYGRHDPTPDREDEDDGWPGSGPGARTAEDNAPPAEDPPYSPRSLQLFPPPAWVVRPGEPGVLRGPLWGFINAFVDGSRLAQPIPQEQDLANLGPQAHQAVAATLNLRTAAPTLEEATRWGLRGEGSAPGSSSRGMEQGAARTAAPDPRR